MRPLEVGLILHTIQTPMTGETQSWEDTRRLAVQAEEIGLDTVWIYDELIYDVESWGGAVGCWEAVAIAAATAEATSTIKVGTWVLSALHRNPGLTAKVGSTLDEISGGRFIFGFGSGYNGPQEKMFGFESDRIVDRYEEALEVVVPLLRQGVADFQGEYHQARQLSQLPPGPRPGEIPIMLGGHGPRTIGLAVEHADIWSAFASGDSHPAAFAEVIELVDQVCEEQGRDPGTLGKSAGAMVEFGESTRFEASGMGTPLSGSPEQIAEEIAEFASMGFTSLELQTFPGALSDLSDVAALLEILDG